MELSIVVDRGDVWYDLPFDNKGNFRQHSRARYPHLTLHVTHNGETGRSRAGAPRSAAGAQSRPQTGTSGFATRSRTWARA
jgi:hypothetical protein